MSSDSPPADVPLGYVAHKAVLAADLLPGDFISGEGGGTVATAIATGSQVLLTYDDETTHFALVGQTLDSYRAPAT